MKKVIVRLVILAVVAGAIYGGYALYKSVPKSQQQVATAKVRRGDVVVRSYARGELRAVRSTTLIAPNLFGTVQITRIAQLGGLAKEKDLIVEFDDSEVNSRVEEKQLEIDQIDEQIKKAQADLSIRNNQDQVDLLRARYSVRRSELEVKRNELLSDIDKKKNLLNLDEARRRLKQLESDIKSRQEQAQAELAVLREKKNKALMEMTREKQRLSQVKLLSPMSGLVAIRQNRPNFMFPGMQIPDLREGDQVQPGVPVADILDLSELELVAKVGELDRANLKEGQDVRIYLDALGEKSFTGHIKSMSGTASANIFSSDPAKKFDVIFSIDMKELLTHLKATPEQIARVLATAEANRKRPVPSSGGINVMMAGGAGPGGGAPVMMATSAGGPQAGGPQSGGMPGAGGMGAADQAQGGQQRRFGFAGPGGQGGQGGGGMFAQLSEDDRKKLREAMQKALNGRSMQELSPEERQKVFAEAAKAVPAAAAMARQMGAGGQRSGGAAAGGAGAPGGMPVMMGMRSQYSEQELAKADLPAAPEAGSNLDVLIRPGLLADVEIILERIPNAIHIPAQGVFEKDGKPIVYVKNGNAWEERSIKPLKRTESVMVIAEGVQPNEIIALADPNAKPGDKKKESASKGGGPMGGMPAGGSGGGR